MHQPQPLFGQLSKLALQTSKPFSRALIASLYLPSLKRFFPPSKCQSISRRVICRFTSDCSSMVVYSTDEKLWKCSRLLEYISPCHLSSDEDTSRLIEVDNCCLRSMIQKLKVVNITCTGWIAVVPFHLTNRAALERLGY
jgi:hypothetical protein